MARATGGLAILLTRDGHGRRYARLKWKDGGRFLLKFTLLRVIRSVEDKFEIAFRESTVEAPEE
jgi:hypothetical protein